MPPSGERVAVKIQYPGLEQRVAVDLIMMRLLARGLELAFKDFQFQWLLPEFTKQLARELDFIAEGRNCDRVARAFRGWRHVAVPRIHWDISSRRVLTMEFIDGVKVNDVSGLQRHGLDIATVARTLTQVMSEMIFVHGFVHGDPHPGNVLVRKMPSHQGERSGGTGVDDPDGKDAVSSDSDSTQSGSEATVSSLTLAGDSEGEDNQGVMSKGGYRRRYNIVSSSTPPRHVHGWRRWLSWAGSDTQVVLIDHGLYITIPDDVRLSYCSLWRGLTTGDAGMVTNASARLGLEKYTAVLPVILTNRYRLSAPLGAGLTKEDRRALRSQFAAGDISSFLEAVPWEMFSVLRVNSFLRSIAHDLGQPDVHRFKANARAAVKALAMEKYCQRGGDACQQEGNPPERGCKEDTGAHGAGRHLSSPNAKTAHGSADAPGGGLVYVCSWRGRLLTSLEVQLFQSFLEAIQAIRWIMSAFPSLMSPLAWLRSALQFL
eukprot:jgi/Mesvir1/26886/Mv20618-RA.2